MPEPAKNIARVKLREIGWLDDGQVDDQIDDPKTFDVQFNPESLKLSYTSSKSGGDQGGGSAIQYVGQGTTKLSMDLVFDASRDSRIASDPESGVQSEQPDVRNLTQQIIDFIKPKDEDRQGEEGFVPPGLRIQWGNFLFDGVVDSVNETLDFWTEDGRPLQAKISLSMSRQEINVRPPTLSNPDGSSAPGTSPMSPAREGDSLASLAARGGDVSNWTSIAAANGIENPRALAAGALIDLKVTGSASAGLGIETGTSSAAGASAGFGVTARAGGSSTVSASAGTAVSATSASSLSSRLTARAPTASFHFDL